MVIFAKRKGSKFGRRRNFPDVEMRTWEILLMVRSEAKETRYKPGVKDTEGFFVIGSIYLCTEEQVSIKIGIFERAREMNHARDFGRHVLSAPRTSPSAADGRHEGSPFF